MFGLEKLIIASGYLGISLVLFAESGVFIGFFLPGDSLVFTLGILAAKGIFNIWILVPLCAVSAIVGDSFGYWFGKKLGPKVFNRDDSFFFNKKYTDRTTRFYAKYGKKTIFLARFVPIVRTFAPILAGVGEMPYKTFFLYNVLGGTVWTAGFLLVGFTLGALFPKTEQYLVVVILGIIAISVVPLVVEYIKANKKEQDVFE